MGAAAEEDVASVMAEVVAARAMTVVGYMAIRLSAVVVRPAKAALEDSSLHYIDCRGKSHAWLDNH